MCVCAVVVEVCVCMDISNLVTSELNFCLNIIFLCLSLSFLLYCVSDYII